MMKNISPYLSFLGASNTLIVLGDYGSTLAFLGFQALLLRSAAPRECCFFEFCSSVPIFALEGSWVNQVVCHAFPKMIEFLQTFLSFSLLQVEERVVENHQKICYLKYKSKEYRIIVFCSYRGDTFEC